MIELYNIIMNFLTPTTYTVKVCFSGNKNRDEERFPAFLESLMESTGENPKNVRYTAHHFAGTWYTVHVGSKTQDWRVRRRFWSALDWELIYYRP